MVPTAQENTILNRCRAVVLPFLAMMNITPRRRTVTARPSAATVTNTDRSLYRRRPLPGRPSDIEHFPRLTNHDPEPVGVTHRFRSNCAQRFTLFDEKRYAVTISDAVVARRTTRALRHQVYQGCSPHGSRRQGRHRRVAITLGAQVPIDFRIDERVHKFTISGAEQRVEFPPTIQRERQM